MDKRQLLHRGYPDSFGLRAPLKLSMTIKEPLFTNHGDFSNSNRINDPWSNAQQNEPSSTPGDLVSLAWLQKGDIIQIAPLDGEEDHQNCFENSTASISSGKSDDFLSTRQPVNLDEPLEFSPFTIRPPTQIESHTTSSASNLSIQRPASADTERYSSPCVVDPHVVNTHQLNLSGQGLAKPNYSYTHLIFMAIESTPQKCMTVNQIYNWCETNFPFYKQAGAGWKNSLRHNLSINKSFKRLPRDSRGPGRGAFWTVEPRERPTLMDAIKRNPWSFANMAAIVSGQSDQSANYNMFGMRRFGLTQSAPGQVLRAAGLGNADLVDTNSEGLSSSIQLPTGGVRLVPTVDGHFIATHDGRLQHLDIGGPSSDGSLNGSSNPNSLVLPDSRYWLSPETNTSDAGAGVEVEWSAEEEEKYARTLQLLMESDNHSSLSTANALSCSERSDSTKLQNQEGIFLADDIKLCTKQRRKSRLQPTRIVEDTYPYTFALMGKCNECKENAASGCELCLAKRRRFLSSSLSNTAMNDLKFVDVANSLDSDQECGPAGGPTVRKQNQIPTPPGSKTDEKKEESDTREVSEEISEEVYVTPAPYIDHEYSHCHAQLRRPDEIRLVNNFNELYCAEAVKRLSKGRSFSKRDKNGHNRTRLFLTPYDESDDDAADDAFSSQDQGTFSDEYSDISEDVEFRTDEVSEVTGYQKRRRAFRRSFRTLGPNLVENAFRPRDGTRRRSSKHSSRARGRRRYSVCHSSSSGPGVTRRSKRVIRAPKRPYDDFEDPFSIEGEELNGFVTRTADKIDDIYAAGAQADSASQNRPQTHLNMESVNGEEWSAGSVRGRRGRKRGRRGRRSNLLYTVKDGESNHLSLPSDQSYSTSDEDEELRYLRIARRRQQMEDSTEHDEVSSAASSGSPNSNTNFKGAKKRAENLPYKVPSGRNPRGTNGTRTTPLEMTTVWGQSRWAMAQKFSAQSWPDCTQVDSEQDDMLEESASGVDGNGEDLDECDVEEIRQADPSKAGERTTVEAAQILLGISQMQSFRRQSGYLSLDSSGTSGSLTIDTSEPVKNTESNCSEALPMTDEVLLDQNGSTTFHCSSPSQK
ncbi:unnamed protein product [Echinostoma caproni]|uniref:Fork-head domain-containing protein n=1 Tax=Echinostoma caproni TaxID=27848 RepID=A0A183AEE2_9TREM|nr:unnamed protein product [Echinostoma caproni]